MLRRWPCNEISPARPGTELYGVVLHELVHAQSVNMSILAMAMVLMTVLLVLMQERTTVVAAWARPYKHVVELTIFAGCNGRDAVLYSGIHVI